MSDVRGYAKWDPKPEARAWIDKANRTMEQYKDYWPLSTRQIFYRLVAEWGYPKDEKAYDKLSQMLSRARRAGMVPWAAIRDGGLGRTVAAQWFRDQEHFEESVVQAATAMKMNRQRGQRSLVELWCEAGGMVPILQGIAAPYSCRVNTGGGYDSVTAKHRLAERVLSRAEEGLRTVILHVGDFDGSGENMCSVLREDAGAMVSTQILRSLGRTWRDADDRWVDADVDWNLIGRLTQADSEPDEAAMRRLYSFSFEWFSVERVALTGDQVIERLGTDNEIETAPPKRKDSRTDGFLNDNQHVIDAMGTTEISAQLEALTPPELEALITGEIEAQLDMDVYAAALEEEEEVRGDVLHRLDKAGFPGFEDD